MDRILLLDFNNYAWLANVIFKPKTKTADAKPAATEGYETPLAPPVETQEKIVPPENVLIFNFFRNLRSLIDQFAPHKVIACLEGHPTFRYELLAEYKANRIIKTAEQQTPSDKNKAEAKDRFNKASPEIIRLLKYLPITTMRHPNYEADDLIGSLVEDIREEDVIVVSNDSDFIQLSQKGYANLRIYSPSKKAMQVAPDYHYLTWKCLAGDKSDNIPSIIGNKTAQKLIANPEKFKEWLEVEENRARFQSNKLLIEFATVPLEDIEVIDGHADFSKLKIEFEQLEFKTITASPYWEKFQRSFQTIRF